MASPAPRAALPGSRLLDDTLARLAIGGPLLDSTLVPPTARSTSGRGIAYGLLRVAMTRDDEALLALADVWSTRALAAVDTDEAFVNRELEITPEVFGTGGLHHSAPGVYATATMIAIARGDEVERPMDVGNLIAVAAIRAIAAMSRSEQPGSCWAPRPCWRPPRATHQRDALRELGDRLADAGLGRAFSAGARSARRTNERVSDISAERMAGEGCCSPSCAGHGRPGVPLPLGSTSASSSSLSCAALPAGLVWPREVGAPDDGRPGVELVQRSGGSGVPLGVAAASVSPTSDFDRLAEGAAWTAYDGPDGTRRSLLRAWQAEPTRC